MAQVLVACFPHSRYTAGWDSRLTLLPLSYCPAWLTDDAIGFFLPVLARGMDARAPLKMATRLAMWTQHPQAPACLKPLLTCSIKLVQSEGLPAVNLSLGCVQDPLSHHGG